MFVTRRSIAPRAEARTRSAGCLWTIGHSTRSIAEFLGLLEAHGIRTVIDVRAIPFSRRNPQFNQPALQESLRMAGVSYHHIPGLGGRRKTRGDSVNVGWRNASFRGYADYMQTVQFQDSLRELMDMARPTPTAIMCAEAVPWRCHRSLIADALVVLGWTVLEIIDAAVPKPHPLPPWARVQNGAVTYPKVSGK